MLLLPYISTQKKPSQNKSSINLLIQYTEQILLLPIWTCPCSAQASESCLIFILILFCPDSSLWFCLFQDTTISIKTALQVVLGKVIRKNKQN